MPGSPCTIADSADWQAASTALGRISSEESAGVAFEAVRSEARTVRGPLASFSSPRAFAVGALYVALALGILIGTLIVNGLILFVIGRRKAALLVTAGEAAAIVAGSIGESFLWWPVLVTFWIGVLVPARILFLERKDGVPQHGLRRALSLVLFSFCCVSVFLWVHGLPSALVGRMKRGLIITAFQAAAGCLILSSSFLLDDVFIVSQASQGIPQDVPMFVWAEAAMWLLTGLGYLLLAGTYVAGVGSAFLDLFAWPGRREMACRIDSVYTQLLSSPHGSSLLLQRLAGTEDRYIKWGTALAQRYRCRCTRTWSGSGPTRCLRSRRAFSL